MAWTTPKTWAADELLTASNLNQYVSDNLAALYALTQGGGRKNLLHNGAMQCHQRSASVAAITTGGYYTADRWQVVPSALGTWTQSVEADAPTGSGFRKSLKMLCTTADAAPDASDYAQLYQKIEGQNLQSVLKGTTSAKQLTLSFWVKSNKTGTYVCELYDGDNTRTVSASYTISASATWEQKTVTFPADLTGAFDNDADASLTVAFWLAAGTDFTSGTLATTWGANDAANRVAGQTNLAAANANYWQLTGAQLEVGSASSGFEFKNYDQDLRECQRYYYRHAAGVNGNVGIGYYWNTTSGSTFVQFPTTMRAAPTVDQATGSDYYNFSNYGGSDLFNTLTLTTASTTGCLMSLDTSVSGTAGMAGFVFTNNAAAYLGFKADL